MFLFRRFEWTDCGLNQVFDRKSKRLVEELIDAKIILAMRAIYQSRMGLALIDTGKFLITSCVSWLVNGVLEHKTGDMYGTKT